MNDIITNILALSTPQEIEEGMGWYRNTSKWVSSLRSPVGRLQTIAALSALSPRNKWERNRADLISLIRDPSSRVGTFGPNKAKALLLLSGAIESEYIEMVLNGRKTRAFYKNIAFPTTEGPVAVDVWMLRLFNTKSYDLVEEAIQKRSKTIGILPHQLQAILWVTGRRLHAQNYDFEARGFAQNLSRMQLRNKTIIGVKVGNEREIFIKPPLLETPIFDPIGPVVAGIKEEILG